MVVNFRSVFRAREGLLVAALIAFCALWYAASPILAHSHGSDSLLPLWMGWTRWTPYYWGQNRFGMPLTAIATFFRSSPWLSYVFYQGALYALSLISVFTLAYSLRPSVPVALISSAVVPLVMTPRWWMEYANQPSGSSMGLFAVGTALFLTKKTKKIAPSRWVISGILIAVAIWINQGLALWVAASFLGQMTWGLERPRYWAWFALCVFGYLANAFLQTIPGIQGPNYSAVILPRDFLQNIGRSAPVIWQACPGPCLLIGIALLIAAFAYLKKRPLFMTGDIFTLRSTLCVFFLTSVLWWTWVNDNNIRYFLPCLVVAVTVIASTAANLIQKPKVLWRAFSFLLVAALYQTGLPGREATVSALETSIHGKVRPDLSRCGVLAGDYWNVWNLLVVTALRQNSLVGLPQGLTVRANPIKDLLRLRLQTEKACFTDTLESAQQKANELGIQVPAASWIKL